MLCHAPGVGSRTVLKLLESYPTPVAVCDEPPQHLMRAGLSDTAIAAIKQPDVALIEKTLHWLEQPGHHLLTLHDPRYPPLLKQIYDPPPLLYARGDLATLTRPQIAMVGSRNPSPIGRQLAESFAAALAAKGLVITSGLALGIDAASHQGALDGGGKTIGVAGTGLDRIYPAQNKELALAIIESGALVSEFPLGTLAKSGHFPRRNRIISGLSLGVLVVEAALQSGSLISARLALEQGREVFAIPGSIHNPLARGCNALIREGAKLVETAEHVLEELNPYYQSTSVETPPMTSATAQSALDLEQQTLLNLVQYSPTPVDMLVKATGQSVETVASILLMLELNGFIASVPGGGYIRLQ